MKRLNGGELLIDFSFDNLHANDPLDAIGLTIKDLQPIRDILVVNSNNEIIDIKKQICLKLMVDDYLVLLANSRISDDKTTLEICGLFQTKTYTVTLPLNEDGVFNPEECAVLTSNLQER